VITIVCTALVARTVAVAGSIAAEMSEVQI